MSSVKVTIYQEGNKNHLEATDVSEQVMTGIIKDFFGVLGGVSVEPFLIKRIDLSNDDIDKEFAKELKTQILSGLGVPSNLISTEPSTTSTATSNVQSTQKKLEKVDSARTLATPIAEMLGEVKEPSDPDGWYSGIKVKDGVNLYQAYYICAVPECGSKGKRWVKEENEYLRCRACNEKLALKPANKLGFPNRDAFGNYFVADEVWVEGEEACDNI